MVTMLEGIRRKVMTTMAVRNAKASLMTAILPSKVFERLNLALTTASNMTKYWNKQRIFEITARKKILRCRHG